MVRQAHRVARLGSRHKHRPLCPAGRRPHAPFTPSSQFQPGDFPRPAESTEASWSAPMRALCQGLQGWYGGLCLGGRVQASWGASEGVEGHSEEKKRGWSVGVGQGVARASATTEQGPRPGSLSSPGPWERLGPPLFLLVPGSPPPAHPAPSLLPSPLPSPTVLETNPPYLTVGGTWRPSKKQRGGEQMAGGLMRGGATAQAPRAEGLALRTVLGRDQRHRGQG